MLMIFYLWGGYNYTTALFSDVSSWKDARIVVIPNEKLISNIIDYKEKFNTHFEELIVLNLDGFGSFLDINHPSQNPWIITEDFGSSDWVSKGIGEGQIGIPKIMDDHINKISGENSLHIKVEEGNYETWEISKHFDPPKNFSEFDIVKLNWYGNGDQKWYVIKFISTDNSYFWYRFLDSSEGWQKIILPLLMLDGRDNIYGIQIQKSTNNNASWNEISRIDFKPSPSITDPSGEFFIDEFVIDNVIQYNTIEDVSGNKLTLPVNLQILELPIASQYNTTANYSPDVPFLINLPIVRNFELTNLDESQTGNENIDTFNVTYLNVFPIIQELDSGKTNSTKLYSVLGKLLNFVKSDLPLSEPNVRSKYALVEGGVNVFRDALLQGDSLLQSSSAIIYLNSSSIQGKVDGTEFEFMNISKILPVDIGQVIVKTSDVKIKPGVGFYSKFIVNSSKLNFVGQPAILLFEENNGYQNVITGKDIEINFDKSTMLLREPHIFSNGTAKFKNFYSFGDPNQRLPLVNQDILVIGKTHFQIKFSDEFTIVHKSSFQGDIILSHPRYQQDELGNISKIFSTSFLPYLGIFSIIFVIINVLIFKKTKTGQIN